MTGHLSFNPVAYDPFAGADVEKAGLTNESQKEIYLSTLIGGEDANRAYNECFSLLLTGYLQVPLLEKAINQLFQRHEALRTTISASGEYVFVHRFEPVSVTLTDITNLPAELQQQHIRELAYANAIAAFDLLNGPLLTFQLVKLAAERHQLIINIHHIIGDGWSVGVILQDLGKLYSALVKGSGTALVPAPQMLAYAREELKFRQSAQQQQVLDYWLKQLKAPVPQLDMPADFARPAVRGYKSRRDDHVLNTALVNALKETGKKQGTSFVTTLLVTFELFLYKVSGQKDIILGLPAAGQASTGNNGLVGHCVNLLPLRSAPDNEMSFADYLKKRKSEVLDAYEHQSITFGSLLKALNIPRDSSRVTLVPVVFNVDLGLDNDVRFEGLQHRLTSFPREYETFELFVNISDSAGQLVVEWSYNTQLFKQKTIQQFHETFERIMKQVTDNAGIRIKALSTGESGNSSQLTGRLNDTDHAYPKDKSLHELITTAAAQHSRNTAVRYGSQTLTYQELITASNRLANVLIALGVAPGDKVGVSLDRTPDMLIALLAVMKAGAVFLPLDPAYPVSRTRYVLSDVAARLMITAAKYAGQYQSLPLLILEDLPETEQQYRATAPLVPYQGHELIYILHTSGSTGQPKGVEVTHRNVVNLFSGMLKNPGITAADKLLAITSISFDIAYVELFLPLLAGAEIVLADADTARDGRELLKIMEEQQISLMQATPATWKMLIEAGWKKPLPLRIITGGEALSLHLAKALLTRCAEVWNMYGPTETAIYATAKKVTAEDQVITIGKPVQNTQVYILDENLQPVPQGSIGEIYIAGEGVARGYINKSKLTAERFIVNAAERGNGRLYKTGDLGRLLPQAEIQCLGRSDHQIKVRGFRIEPEEIEFYLVSMPGVREVVVHGYTASPEEELKLVAFIVAPGITDQEFDIRVLRWKEKLAMQLPAYMVPQHIVRVAAIPLSPNGKTDKKQLDNLAARKVNSHRRELIAPETKEQQLIAAIWKELLHLDKVSIHDDFFELGGHSLTAVSVMVKIEKETGIRLPIATLFAHETIAKLALLITEEKDREIKWSSVVPIKPGGTKTPVFVIHGSGLNILMFHSVVKYFGADRPFYGIQALGLDGTDPHITSIEDVASRYISDMREVYPDGPYIFLGYSLGGMIALEMTKQLEAMGKQVTMLGMIDTYVDNVALFSSRRSQLIKKIARQFPKLLFFARSFFIYPKDTLRYQLAGIRNRFRKLAGKGEEKMITAEQSFQEKIYEDYERAYLDYRLEPTQLPVHLFKVKKKLYYLDDPKYMGWKPFARGGLFIHHLPGDHKTFIEHPNEVKFVQVLEKAIATAEKNDHK